MAATNLSRLLVGWTRARNLSTIFFLLLQNQTSLPPVSRFCTTSGEWDFPFLRSLISENLVLHMACMSLPHPGSGEYVLVWGCEKDGRFRIRSAYALLGGQINIEEEPDCRVVWRWRGPNHIRHFLWLVAHNRLLTNEERRRRHMATEGVCSRCNQHQETALHVLRECPFAVTTWEHLAYLATDRMNWESPLLPWITHHLKASSNSLIFGVACWSLWKARNEVIFTDICTTPESLAQRIRHFVESIEEALILEQSTHTCLPTKMMVDVSWPLPPSWVALNSDRSVIPQTRRAAAGGLFRDSDGRCLAAYSMNLGICSITRAEMRDVVQGLHFAWEFGYRQVRVQLDSHAAIQLLMEEGERAHQHSSKVAQFHELLNRN
ncbi:unnamed protein product [Cuscuta europaea]|uniref:Reverse transcriptase zinc-binding domain-containing protein n=1 Tax=Cuscuta europaea TaxID=41803 RepID=A0A9P0YGJ7_CUSEU|nr:unnamed protein product [Cuscuta europaea]